MTPHNKYLILIRRKTMFPRIVKLVWENIILLRRRKGLFWGKFMELLYHFYNLYELTLRNLKEGESTIKKEAEHYDLNLMCSPKILVVYIFFSQTDDTNIYFLDLKIYIPRCQSVIPNKALHLVKRPPISISDNGIYL